MVLRSLLAATALLTAACFVDNQPIDASASVAASDPASSTTAGPTTTTTAATGLPASTTGEPTSSGTGEPGTTTTTAATTTPVTTDPATTDPATTGAAEPCASLPELGGALTLPACAACVQAHCCEPFDTCAGSDTCTKAWACISAEPCQSKWLQCPGVGEAAAPFSPRGFNYDHDRDGRLLEDYWLDEWPAVERHFAQMKRLGANLVRIHLQFGKFMDQRLRPEPRHLERLKQLLVYADRMGIERLCVYMGMKWSQDPSPDDLVKQNDEAMRAIAKFPDRAFGFVYLSEIGRAHV